jgi:ribosome biogenesis GTPase
LIEGLITKGIGGFYDVKTANGIIVCKGRGLFRKDQNLLIVGDEVGIEETDNGMGIIREIRPRKNEFARPPVANVDQLVIVMSLAKPEPNYLILDRFLVMAERKQVDIVIGFNKVDLASDQEIRFASDVYKDVYPTVFLCGKSGEGIQELELLMIDKRTAFAGPSGVGKSTLLNRIHESLKLDTGTVSRKTSRGKHTTRHVELFDMVFNGMIFDTPGFTSFDILDASEEELHYFFPEFSPYIGLCRFNSCRHINEPDCAVKAAAADGKIHTSRMNSYLTLYNEIQDKDKRRY